MAVTFVMRITFLLLLAVAYGLAEGAPPMAKPNCPASCGNVSIPYPFGIGSNCFMNKTYEIVCNEGGVAAAAIVFLPSIGREVLEINLSDLHGTSPEPGLIRVKMPIFSSSNCTNQNSAGSVAVVNITGTPFFFSSRNKFISVGCDNLAIMTVLGPMVVNLVGCMTDCSNKKLRGKCLGFDCCQNRVPDGIQLFDVTFYSTTKTSSCQRAFLVETQWLDETDPSASNHVLNLDYVPVVLEWTAFNFSDYDFNSEELYYRRHINLANTTYGVEYYYCPHGFEGNPYLNMGCQELQKMTSPSQTENPNFFLEKSQVQCQLASVSDRRQLKKQLLEAASQISDDEDDTIMESSSPNYRTHPEAFQDSQDPYDM